MRRHITLEIFILTTIIAVFCFARGRAAAQGSATPSRITATIDESKLAVLRGNTHPFARAANDRGPVGDGLQMDRLLLVLQRSPEQQAALDRLLADQQNASSANYHRWLTPEEFGRQFGASDDDIAKISAWLESHGFQIDGVSKARNLVTFSGTAGSVRSAFHTVIHQYFVKDETHLANSNDPAIPAALASVVAGVRSFNDFFPQASHHSSRGEGFKAKIAPHLTLTDSKNNTLFAVGPTDFATIYGITPLWNASQPIDGSGVTIAIVSASDINTTDVAQFRTLFGLPTINFNKVIPTGSTDPGVVGPNAASNGTHGDEDETEAIFDVEWSGAVAKNAKIDLVASKDTVSTAGIDLSAEWIVDQNLAPILSESYGECELGLGTTGNAFYSNLWSQAASEGITVSISTGDTGAAGCDSLGEVSTTTSDQEAVFGLGVNGIASTPYDVAVGGTDFNDHTTPNAFWSSQNASGTLDSAQSYVPELAWNDSCTNSLIYQAFGDSSALTACNDPNVANDGNDGKTADGGFFFVSPIGGSGGVSNCTNAPSNASQTSQCTGGYAKPSWQTGVGVPNDGHRDIPDVSFLAEGSQDSYGLEQALGDNVPGSFYFACEEDAQGSSPSQPAACSTSGAFLLGGGTSISAQVFAGVVALVDEKSASAQGNMDSQFYSLASSAAQTALNCNSSSTTVLPNSACIFHDVTVGTNAMPCKPSSSSDGTNDCSANSNAIGVETGYNAGTGYDEVTGLGSINVANLLGGVPYLSISASPTTVTVATPGQSGTTTLTLTGNNGFTATIDNLTCSNLPKGASCAFTQNGSAVSSLTLNSGSPTAAVTLTVTTTAASIAPVRFHGPSTGLGRWISSEVVLLAAMLMGAFGFLGARGNKRRWVSVFGILAFAVAIGVAGCSGNASNGGSGGSGGGNTTGGTPTGSTTATVSVTDAANNSVVSYNFTLAVN
jgi:subtilase family serine protease